MSGFRQPCRNVLCSSVDQRSAHDTSVDEFGVDEQGCDEAELAVAVLVSVVGIPAELPVVRQPRVGTFNNPTQPETYRLFLLRDASWFAPLDVEMTNSLV